MYSPLDNIDYAHEVPILAFDRSRLPGRLSRDLRGPCAQVVQGVSRTRGLSCQGGVAPQECEPQSVGACHADSAHCVVIEPSPVLGRRTQCICRVCECAMMLQLLNVFLYMSPLST